MIHPLLARQLRTVGLSPDAPPADAHAWQAVLDQVGRAYTVADQDRDLLERSLASSSQEMQALYTDLRRSEERFRSLVQNASDVIVVLAADGAIQYASASATRVFGYDPADWLGRDGFSLIHPDDLDTVRQAFVRVCTSGGMRPPIEFRLRHADGSWRHVEATANNLLDDPSVAGIVETLRDVTERRWADDALRAAEARYRATFEHAIEGIFQAGADGHLRAINPAGARMIGYASAEEFLAEDPPLKDIYLDGDAARTFNQRLRADSVVTNFECRLRHRDGSAIWVMVNARAERDTAGRITLIEGFVTDITERKQAELTTAQLAAIVQSSDDAIMGLGLDGTIASWNTGATRIFGRTAAAMVGRPLAALFVDRPDDLATALSHVQAGQALDRFETSAAHPDGRWLVLSVTLSPIRDATGAVIRLGVVARDITEERELAGHLARTEKLSALGELAAGMAHEVNNPLGVVAGTAELALRGDMTPELREDLTVIRREAARAGEIVKAMLRFARQRGPSLEPLDLTAVVHEALALRGDRLANHGITLTWQPVPTAAIIGDRDQLLQVVINLINNAVEAMKQQGGGRLCIAVADRGDQVEMSVEDSGPGIPPAVLSRIFDPFFTTKPPGEGTGLGLSVSHRIVADHDGELSAENRASGACFRMSLPVCHTPETVAGGADTAPVLIIHPDRTAGQMLAEAVHVIGMGAQLVNETAAIPSGGIAVALVWPGVADATLEALTATMPGVRLIAAGPPAAGDARGWSAVLPDRFGLADIERALAGLAP